jgi:hypothetical protein
VLRDGSKFRAVASIDTVRERLALQRYLDSLEKAGEEPQTNIDQSINLLDKLHWSSSSEIESRKRASCWYVSKLCGVQHSNRVDTEHALIVTHAVVLDASDIRCLRPMAEAAKRALEVDSFQ